MKSFLQDWGKRQLSPYIMMRQLPSCGMRALALLIPIALRRQWMTLLMKQLRFRVQFRCITRSDKNISKYIDKFIDKAYNIIRDLFKKREGMFKKREGMIICLKKSP